MIVRITKKYYKILFYISLITVFIIAVTPGAEIEVIPNSDKILHIFAFFILSLELNRASATMGHRFRNMGALLAFGIFIEFAQSFTPNRTASLYDVIADVIGILLFQFWYSAYKFYKHK
jgi:VanZ family protein